MAELEGGSVVFFAVLLRRGTLDASSKVDCRVTSYAWNWVLGKLTIDWEDMGAGIRAVLFIHTV